MGHPLFETGILISLIHLNSVISYIYNPLQRNHLFQVSRIQAKLIIWL